jgi:hypothetical protein
MGMEVGEAVGLWVQVSVMLNVGVMVRVGV